jgi:hypothetical protein
MPAPKLNLTADEKRILREAFVKAFGEAGSVQREAAVKEMCEGIGRMLRQEYRLHEGQWWLFTLGKPARPLTPDEIIDAKLK